MQRSERAKWVFSRQSIKQLGYIKESERIDAEKQIKLLFEVWGSDKSETIEVDALVHGLIAIGLGASPEFTKTVTKSRSIRIGCMQSF